MPWCGSCWRSSSSAPDPTRSATSSFWLYVLGERHLVWVLREYFDHYNRARPHRALRLRPPEPQQIPDGGEIVRRQRLHSLINEYSRVA